MKLTDEQKQKLREAAAAAETHYDALIVGITRTSFTLVGTIVFCVALIGLGYYWGGHP